jgi:hypothetical protein
VEEEELRIQYTEEIDDVIVRTDNKRFFSAITILSVQFFIPIHERSQDGSDPTFFFCEQIANLRVVSSAMVVCWEI